MNPYSDAAGDNDDDFDPFAMFGQDDAANDPFQNWDPFADAFDQDSDDGHIFAEAPSTFSRSPQDQIPITHRRTISSPMRLITPSITSTISTPVAQLPVAMSTFDFQSPQTRRAPAIPQPTLPPNYPQNLPPHATKHLITPQIDLINDDPCFLAACSDPNLRFNPRQLGFIPQSIWTDQEISFGEVVTEFFQRKNNANSRFSHKLFNALILSDLNPIYPQLVGVFWLTNTILRVDKRAFARLLGIKSIDGSLFHQQGNFPSHGFFEIGAGDVHQYCPPGLDLTGVDFENIRLLIHSEHLFMRGCTEADIENCRWASSRNKKL